MKNESERSHFVNECDRSHHIRREGAIAHQFRVRVSNYAERALFEMDNPDKSHIDLLWRQGAGINVVVCGYSRNHSVLLQLNTGKKG